MIIQELVLQGLQEKTFLQEQLLKIQQLLEQVYMLREKT